MSSSQSSIVFSFIARSITSDIDFLGGSSNSVFTVPIFDRFHSNSEKKYIQIYLYNFINFFSNTCFILIMIILWYHSENVTSMKNFIFHFFKRCLFTLLYVYTLVTVFHQKSILRIYCNFLRIFINLSVGSNIIKHWL